MALSLPARQVRAALRWQTPLLVEIGRFRQRNVSNVATATVAAAGSNLSESTKQDIAREASLTNPDPPSDSQTSALLDDQLHYMVPTYVRPPPMFIKGKGCYLWDVENRRYLDFTAGIAVNGLGHCDDEIGKLIGQQARTLVHTSNLYHNPWTGSLSRLLVSETKAAGAMANASRVFISNSGSEANEAALKFARKVGKTLSPDGSKHAIVSFHRSFHGRSFGSLSATPNPKYQAPFAPMIPGFRYGHYNDVEAVGALITPETCGVIVEPIQGEGGVYEATPAFLTALRRRCDAVGAVLIYDEIQCGLSRSGQLWAHQAAPAAAHPDILTTAKALGNGFPIGATLVSEDVAGRIVTGDHGTTFGGNPLACRVAHHVVDRLADRALQAAVRAKEARFRAHFARLRARHPDVVTEVRGRGLLLGLQLRRDPGPLLTAARERGLLLITCGADTLRFVPPLTISDAEIDQGMAILEHAMEAVFGRGESAETHGITGVGASQEM